MTELTKTKTAFLWSPEATTSFEQLRSAISSSPVIIHPNPNKPFYVECDASDFAVGAVLLERMESGNLHPVAYYSKKLLPAEMNYTVHDKELLAIVKAFEHWRHYLVGSPHRISVFSNHKNNFFLHSEDFKTSPRSLGGDASRI